MRLKYAIPRDQVFENDGNGNIFPKLITCKLVHMILPKYFSYTVRGIEFYKIESSHL